MKAIRIRVAQATVAGRRGIVAISIDKGGNKTCMAFIDTDVDGTTSDFIVTDKGELVSEEESMFAQLLAEIED